MKKQILILYSRDKYPGGQRLYEHHVDKLNAQAVTDDVAIECFYGVLSELVFWHDGDSYKVVEPRSGRDIANFDLVFFQKWKFEPQVGLAAAVYLDMHHVRYISRELRRQNPFDKLSEMSCLLANGLPYAPTFSTAASMLHHQGLELLAKYPLAYPLIVKPVAGTRGEGIQLLRDEAAVRQYIAALSPDDDTRLLLQSFISNDYDYRVTIMGGQIAYVLRRSASEGSIVNNTSAGGEAVFVEQDEWTLPAISDAVRAAQAVGREDFAGVDVLVGHSGHVILEVNKSPEIQTGYGTPRKMSLLARYLAQKASADRPTDS